MNILPIQQNSNNYKYKQPVFRSFVRSVSLGSTFYRNDTSFFRDAAFWNKLSDFLIENFKNIPKVNVYSYGCSDGSEPFTFVMQMLAKAHKCSPDKFFPVIAKDNDSHMIEKIKAKDFYYINGEEKFLINHFTDGQYNRFFAEIDKTIRGAFAFAKEELYNNVEFSQGDIKKDYKNIKPNNSIVLVRNFWPYIDEWPERQKILNNIGRQLGENSYIIIGEFDQRGTAWKIDNQIIEAGFQRTPVEYMFKKI